MTNKISVVRDAVNSSMGEALAAKLPVGETVAVQAVGQDQSVEAAAVQIGVWESSPGKFRRNVASSEFSHIVSGWCTFTPDGDAPVELRAGDAVFFPANTRGTWDIREHVRKTYVIFQS